MTMSFRWNERIKQCEDSKNRQTKCNCRSHMTSSISSTN
jgi:hypothetical protein